MAVLKCKMCGGDLEVNENMSVGICQYCGSTMTIPRAVDEKKANMFNRANQLRLDNRFDDAKKLYEDILVEDSADAEAYWGVVLCKYGIEYVDDPKTTSKIPTCHRTYYTSIYTDSDYLEVLKNADVFTKPVYQEEAERINLIQKGILEQSKKEEPFDVFICYKETDDSGERTKDSVIAQDIYYELTKRGYKTFFARKTLENKLGTAYEPVIFSALNSAKVMVVLATSPEIYNAVWVKNEWSRYLDFANKDDNKLLIPAYRDFSPYNLPVEFANLQALDMSKIGFIQDLVDGIGKVISGEDKQKDDKPTVSPVPSSQVTISSLLKRVELFLSDGDFESADEYCEKVLDADPENPRAYIGKTMAKFNCTSEQDLSEIGDEISFDPFFKKAVKYSSGDLRKQYVGYVITYYNNLLQSQKSELDNIYSSSKEKEQNFRNSIESQTEIMLVQKQKLQDEKDKCKKFRKTFLIVFGVFFAIMFIIGCATNNDYMMSLGFVLFFLSETLVFILPGLPVDSAHKALTLLCRTGLSAVDGYKEVLGKDFELIKEKKSEIVETYKVLKAVGADVPEKCLALDIKEDAECFNNTVIPTDFDFAKNDVIALDEKEKNDTYRAELRAMKKEMNKLPPQQRQSTIAKYKASAPKMTVPAGYKNKWVAFTLCFFLGYFGIHKLYEGKVGMFLLYLFTFGFCGIGWICDCLILLAKPNPYRP